ncbi:MAG: hypothetical protein ABF294_04645 [Flavobacteriales bacterium]
MKKIIAFCFSILFLASCSTSSDVASSKLLQKRKYQKGWHSNRTPIFDKNNQNKKEIYSAIKVSESTQELVAKKEIDEEVLSEYSVETNSVLNSTVHYENSTKVKQSLSNVLNKEETLPTIIENQNSGFISLIPDENSSSMPVENSDSTSRILLMLLGIVMLFIGIPPPLAIFVAVGMGGTFKFNLYLFLISSLFLITAFVVAAIVGVNVALGLGFWFCLLAAFILYLAAFIHALITIIRGFFKV